MKPLSLGLIFAFDSYWDGTTNNWAFDYDAYYAAHPQTNTMSTLDNATYQQQAFEQASAYGTSSASGFNTFGPAAGGSSGEKKKKIPVGPKDANGELIAGNLKKGQTRETVLRKSVGKLYEDQTLLEWDPSHKRLFVGDLGNDVSDATLAQAFEKYPTFSKARVVRKKSDGKSKGYGFVAFADPHDFLKAWKEMDGEFQSS